MPPDSASPDRSDGRFMLPPLEATTALLTQPAAFFRDRTDEGSLMGALVYGYLAMLLGFAGALVVNFLMQSGAALLLDGSGDLGQRALLLLLGLAAIPFVLLVLVPFTVVLNGALYHLAAVLLGAASAPWTATLHVVAFAQAAMLAMVIPLVGPLVGIVWVLVLVAIGLRQVHGITPGRVILTLVVGWILAGVGTCLLGGAVFLFSTVV